MALKTEQLDRLTAVIVDHLPETIEARKEVLVAYLAILPRDYRHRDEITALIQGIRDHQLHQTEFRALLNGKAK